MNIDKAIEILEELERHSSLAFASAELDAIKLGIEALKFYKRLEHAAGDSYQYLLPGETED